MSKKRPELAKPVADDGSECTISGYPGLGLSGAEIDRKKVDTFTLAALRARLNDEVKDPRRTELTRPNMIGLLDAIVEVLRPLTEQHIGRLKTGQSVVTDHPAIALLVEIIDVHRDLDRGKTHTALKPARDQTNAALSIKQLKQDQVLVEGTVIAQLHFGLPTLAEAARFHASKLRKSGVKRKGKDITPQILKSLRDHPKKPLR